METYTKGDIVIFPFPYTNLAERKVRPALVLSNEMDEDILLCQITSTNIPKDKYSVYVGKQETKQGSLAINSFIRANMLFTASKQQIIKKVCTVNNHTYKHVCTAITQLITIN